MLPKTSGAKNAYVPVEDQLLACSLATSACTSLQAHCVNPHLDDIHKLDMITTRLDTLATAQPPANCSYAHIVTMGAKSAASTKAHLGLCYELTLAQANCSCPILSDLSNDGLAGLLEKVNETLMDMDCHLKSRPCTPARMVV